MIDREDIKQRDFSISLPMLINRLQFIGMSLEEPENAEGMPRDSVNGAGSLILDITSDLQRINKALYGEDEREMLRVVFKAKQRGFLVEQLLEDIHNDTVKEPSAYMPRKEAGEQGASEEKETPAP